MAASQRLWQSPRSGIPVDNERGQIDRRPHRGGHLYFRYVRCAAQGAIKNGGMRCTGG